MIKGTFSDNGKEYLIQGSEKICGLTSLYNSLIDLNIVQTSFAKQSVEYIANNYNDELKIDCLENSISKKGLRPIYLDKISKIEKEANIERKVYYEKNDLESALNEMKEKNGNLIMYFSGHAAMIKDYVPELKTVSVIDSMATQKLNYTLDQVFNKLNISLGENTFCYLITKKE
jgi:hypothetical protein